jgi:hypothetical protein
MEGVTLIRKKANTTCGSVLYINKENCMNILIIQIHLANRFLPAKFRIKYANMNNFKQPVYFHERKFKAPQTIYVSKGMHNCNLKSVICLVKILS